MNRSCQQDPAQERSFHSARSVGILGLVPRQIPSSCNRFVICARGDCRRQFSVCVDCDGGRRYCGPECARAARRLGLSRAGRAYQATERGRELHAARQARYRDRRRAVTHHRLPDPPLLGHSGTVSPGTSLSPADAVGTAGAVPETTGPSSSPGSTACVSCGRCSSFVRLYFLVERGSAPTAARRKRPPKPASQSWRAMAAPPIPAPSDH